MKLLTSGLVVKPESLCERIINAVRSFPLWSPAPNSLVVRKAKSILADRKFTECRQEWQQRGEDWKEIVVFLGVIRVLMRPFIRWPNEFFFPDDQARVVLGYEYVFDDTELCEVINPLCDIYGIGRTSKKERSFLFGGVVFDEIYPIMELIFQVDGGKGDMLSLWQLVKQYRDS